MGRGAKPLPPAPTVLDIVLAAAMHLLTTGQGTLWPRSSILGLLTTQARDSYPWPLAWANALAGYVCFKRYRAALPGTARPGLCWSVIATFFLYTMPANLFTNYLVFGRTPGALTSSLVLPIHLVCCALVEFVPGAWALLNRTAVFTLIDCLGVLDCITTGLNFVEEAHAATGSATLALLAGVVCNVAGGVARHFYVHGGAGRASFDAALLPNLRFALLLNGAHLLALRGWCASDAPCVASTGLYELLPLIAVVRNLAPTLYSSVGRITVRGPRAPPRGAASADKNKPE